MNDTTQPFKAVTAFALTFLVALANGLQGQKDNLGNMSATEWLFVVISAVAVAGATYLVPNPPKTARRGELGQGYIGLAAGVLLIVILVIVLLRLA